MCCFLLILFLKLASERLNVAVVTLLSVHQVWWCLFRGGGQSLLYHVLFVQRSITSVTNTFQERPQLLVSESDSVAGILQILHSVDMIKKSAL